MLTLKMILENREDVVRRLEKKHFAAAAEMIDNVIAADARRRAAQQESDAMQAQMNQYAKSIGGLMKEGKKEEAAKVLNNYTQKYASSTAKTWEDLKAELWTMFARSM